MAHASLTCAMTPPESMIAVSAGSAVNTAAVRASLSPGRSPPACGIRALAKRSPRVRSRCTSSSGHDRAARKPTKARNPSLRAPIRSGMRDGLQPQPGQGRSTVPPAGRSSRLASRTGLLGHRPEDREVADANRRGDVHPLRGPGVGRDRFPVGRTPPQGGRSAPRNSADPAQAFADVLVHAGSGERGERGGDVCRSASNSQALGEARLGPAPAPAARPGDR